VLNFLRKKSEPKLLLTSRGFSGTIYLLSFLSNLKNSVVAWKCPHDSKYFPNGITIFGKADIGEECYIADEEETINNPLSDIFSRMVKKKSSSDLYCIGHWFNLHDLDVKYGYRYLKKNNIKIVNLVRHPVDRTHSNWYGLQSAFSENMPEDHKAGFIGTIKSHKEWLDDFLKKHNISLSNTKDITFIGACLNLFACGIDASYKKYLHLKIESLNSERRVSILEKIIDGKFIIDGNDIEKNETIRNSHVAKFHQSFQAGNNQINNIPVNTHEKFSSWLPWQQELYKLCVIKSKLNQHYKQHEYELYI